MINEVVTATVGELMTLADQGCRPAEALARVRALRERRRGCDVELLWQEEQYDGSVHYDVLLNLPGRGTVSLSFSPQRTLPWPLRGVQRSSERTLLRVNGAFLWIDHAIACLDFIWEDGQVIDRLVNACLVQDILGRDPIALSADELQEAMDAFRRARKLYTAQATKHWMARRGLTHAQLEAEVADEAVVAKLRERVTGELVEPYFTAHHADFDLARIARIDFEDAADASQAYDAIRSGELDFSEAAERRILVDVGAAGFVSFRRGDAPDPALGEPVFSAIPGQVLPPVAVTGGYAVAKVLSLTPARLDGATRRTVEQKLFADWLDEAADISWN